MTLQKRGLKPVWEILDSGYWRHEKGVSPMSPGSIIHIITNLTRNPTQHLKNQEKIILKFFLGVGPCVWSFASWALLCCSTRYSQDQMNNKKSPNRLNHREIQRPFQYYKNCLILAPEKTWTVQLWDYLWPVYNYHGVLQPFFVIN